jgi:hypothetical protein
MLPTMQIHSILHKPHTVVEVVLEAEDSGVRFAKAMLHDLELQYSNLML